MSTEHVDEHFMKHVKACLFIFGALMVLTVVTVLISYVHIGHEGSTTGNIIVALIIATFKALLVGAYFMHLNAEKKTIFQVLGITFVFFFVLMFLTLFAFSDQLFS